jgi:RNA polymerase sigma factor (sigma-70 family)
MTDWELLQRYARKRSEAAFAELVRRHLGWVYSVALRQVRQPELAEEVAQSVFVLLARKAGSLRSGTKVGGWLFRTTRFVGSRALRAELRLKKREQTAWSMSAGTIFLDDDAAVWERIVPHLDEAVAALSEPERTAILLRFYEKKRLHEIGEQLGIGEEAAKKRISRAVDRLRTFLTRRGVAIGGTVLAGLLTERAVEAAPVALASAVLKSAAGGVSATAASAVLPELVRETLEAWRWAKIKLAAGVGAAAVFVIFVAATVNGRLMRHPTSQIATADRPIQPELTTPTEQAASGVSGAGETVQVAAVRKTGALTGFVLDDRGRPAAGAKVWGGFSSEPYAEDTTDEAGQFALSKIAAPTYVTVTADGYAADQQAFELTNATESLVFHLVPARPLAIRLVNESGEGVSGSQLFLAKWWGRTGTLAQHLPQETDANGRLVWLSPPKGELELQFGSPGYCFSRTNKFFADGEEHTIVLHPSATATGKVTDSDTGAPVANFKYTMGHGQSWVATDPTPLWELQSQFGSNGFFGIVLEEEQKPYVRIEAEGYNTLETEIQLTNAHESVCNFQLTRESATNSIRGRVMMPDGNPAGGVGVALCTERVGARLNGTSIVSELAGTFERSRRGDYRKTTDAEGFFMFRPIPGAHTVVAAGPAGLGQARCFDFSKPLEIRLQPWGRIEGNVRTRDGIWSRRKLYVVGTGHLTRWATVSYNPKSIAALSDSEGKFTLERVPPGDCRVVISDDAESVRRQNYLLGPGPHQLDSRGVVSPVIHVEPGETAEVQVGGVGRSIIGKLVAPAGVELRSWTNQVTFAQLHVEWSDYHIPEGLTPRATERWRLEFEDTETGRAWLREQYAYYFKVNADGSFFIPEVLPGKYRLFVNVGQGYLGSGPDATPGQPMEIRIASTAARVTVDEDSGENGTPIYLGEVVLTPDR